MRTVGIHLDEDVVAALEPPGEAGEVGLAEPLLARAMQDVDVVVMGSEVVGKIARAIRRVVVGDEHMRIGDRQPQSLDDSGEALRFVVRRNDDEDASGHRSSLCAQG